MISPEVILLWLTRLKAATNKQTNSDVTLTIDGRVKYE